MQALHHAGEWAQLERELREGAPGDVVLFSTSRSTGVAADGFLYHMVRNIIGTLANVGLGVLTPARFGEILEGRDRTKASATAPACGLYLEHVDYGETFHF